VLREEREVLEGGQKEVLREQVEELREFLEGVIQGELIEELRGIEGVEVIEEAEE
tara:strand:+ start:685 stop:849 length:165 start_codon:yes stop_codon:yes gene_type:complete